MGAISNPKSSSFWHPAPQVPPQGHDPGDTMVILSDMFYNVFVRTHTKFGTQIFELNFVVERGSCMVWGLNIGNCPRLDFENIMFFNCLGYNFNIYDAFEFLCNSIANLWRHEWYHYNTLG